MTGGERHEFRPDWTLRPGVLIREELEARGMTDEDFAARTGLRLPAVRGILHGSARIDEAAAAAIARAFGTSAQMWLNAQELYDQAIARGAKDMSEEHDHD